VKQSWHARRSPPWSGYSTRLWPWSTTTFFTRSRSIWERQNEKILPISPTASSVLTCFFRILLPKLLSHGSIDVIVLSAEVAWAQEAIATAEAACAAAMLVTETSAQEAAMVWNSVDHHIKGAKDGAALAQREALERVS
jgi:hypothetical protein